MKFYRWAPQEISVRLSVAAFPRNFSAKTRNTKSMLSFSLPVLRQNRPQNNKEIGVCHRTAPKLPIEEKGRTFGKGGSVGGRTGASKCSVTIDVRQKKAKRYRKSD